MSGFATQKNGVRQRANAALWFAPKPFGAALDDHLYRRAKPVGREVVRLVDVLREDQRDRRGAASSEILEELVHEPGLSVADDRHA